MIRNMEPSDLDAVLDIWLESNLQAHPFVPAGYWRDNLEMVREQLPRGRCMSGRSLPGYRASSASSGGILRASLSGRTPGPGGSGAACWRRQRRGGTG